MGKFSGKLSTASNKLAINELRIGCVELTAAEAVALDADGILDGQATSAAATVVTEFLAQPPFPRNLTILPGGTTADVAAGSVVVVGTNFADEVISESFAFLAKATEAVAGTAAFKKVTKITFPEQDGAAATFDVGWGDVIGLPYEFGYNAVLGATRDGIREVTFPTVAFDADDVEENTVKLSAALNGKALKIFLAV